MFLNQVKLNNETSKPLTVLGKDLKTFKKINKILLLKP